MQCALYGRSWAAPCARRGEWSAASVHRVAYGLLQSRMAGRESEHMDMIIMRGVETCTSSVQCCVAAVAAPMHERDMLHALSQHADK